VTVAGVFISVVGLAADGRLDAAARERVLGADVVLGSERQLGLLPPAGPVQERVLWPRPLRERLPALLASYAGRRVVALASGDPLVSGIGTTLISLLGAASVEIIPALSSVALARARMRWASETCEVVRLVDRDAHAVLAHLAPGHRLLVLSADESTPSVVSRLLTAAGYGASRLTVLGDLGTPRESRRETAAASWQGDAPRLHVLAVELQGQLTTGWVPGLPDEAFEHDGQLTKRDLRASALARLLPAPGRLLWDVGAGAGSIGIEWQRAHPRCRAIAIEADAERAARIRRNAERLGVPSLEIVTGHAPEALSGLPAPDAVFIGGGATQPGLLDTCLAALGPGGRLVVHGVTLETETLLADRHARLGGELTRLSVERVDAIGSFRGWRPQRPVVQWAWGRPAD